ncbi:MAG: glucosaminidase domain-containing protein [Eubacterium sp.]|nr:glucosaminidase domain-containing protein [Candidatus Colimonas fimequi]
MIPKYYDIDEINSKQTHHKKAAKIIIIVAIALAAVIFIAGTLGAPLLVKALASDNESVPEDLTDQVTELDFGEIIRENTVDEIISGAEIPALSRDQIYSLDLSKPSGVTVGDLKLCTKGALVGLEEDFWQLEQDYDINCLFVMAIASHESANGTICFRKNNMFGFGTKGFSSKAEGIRVVGKTLANSYLSEDGRLYKGKTVEAVHKRYAASPTWDDKVVKNMVRYYSNISENHNKAIEALK